MAKNTLLLFVCAAFCISSFSCNKTAAVPEPSIVSFSPTSGSVGTTVVITGVNLKSSVVSSVAHMVNFNGTAATVTSTTPTSITTTVPAGATTGKISVSLSGVTSTSSSSFTVY